MARTRLNRSGLLLTAVFQLLLPMFVSVADARAEAAAERGASSHIEAHGTATCVPAHARDCALCRVLAGGATVTRAVSVRVAATRVITATMPSHARTAVGTSAQGEPSQRAPPSM